MSSSLTLSSVGKGLGGREEKRVNMQQLGWTFTSHETHTFSCCQSGQISHHVEHGIWGFSQSACLWLCRGPPGRRGTCYLKSPAAITAGHHSHVSSCGRNEVLIWPPTSHTPAGSRQRPLQLPSSEWALAFRTIQILCTYRIWSDK